MNKTLDLLFLLVVAGGAVLLIGAAPFLAPARVAFGLAFVCFCPGYALVAALFPQRDELPPVERLALALGLSLALVPLAALGLNYSPWGIRLWPLLASLGAFVAVCTAVAAVRRLRLTGRGAVPPESPAPPARPRRLSVLSAASAATLMAALLFLAASAYLAAVRPAAADRVTEFYVLDAAGELGAFPLRLRPGEDARLRVVIVNREGEPLVYRVESRPATFAPQTLQLQGDERGELELPLRGLEAAAGQQLELLLYKGGERLPYRTLHLRFEVAAAPTPAGGTQLSVQP